MKIKSQLIDAQLEQRASAPTKKSEILVNTAASDQIQYHDGSNVRTVVNTDQAQSLSNKTVVVANNTITTAASGNLAATELNAALAELQGDIDTRATTTDLNNHLNDAVDAHDASAISITAISGISATEVQGTLAEIVSDIDSHLSDATDAHDASAISSVPSGNLAATDVQTALNELQTDIDTRALASDLTNHLSDTIDAHDASAISFVAGGTIAATDVQAAISEVATDAASALSTHESDTSTHGVGVVAGLTETQAFTNKDYDGGTASNTSRITLPKATKSTLDGLNRKEATIVYATDTAKAYIDNGSSLVAVGSGSGDGINYITDGDAESALTGATYKDAAQTSPVDGTGGSASITWTRSASSPIRGSQSYILDKPASNCQGEGVAIPFPHPGMVEGNQVEFEYNVNSGSFTTGYLRVYAVDVTTGAVIEPSSVEVQNVGITIKHISNFQTTLNSTSYRLCLHVADSSSTAWSLKVDSIKVGPQVTTIGSYISDWTAYTPIATGLTNGTWTGLWRRVGDTMECQIRGVFGGASAGSSLALSIPSGHTIDTAKIPNVAFLHAIDGSGFLFDTSASAYFGLNIGYNSTTQVFVSYDNGVNGQALAVTATAPVTLALNDTISLTFRVPITGWGSNVSFSSADSGRVIAAEVFRAVSTANQSIPASTYTPVGFDSVTSQTTNWFTSGTSDSYFTVQEAGWYQLNASVAFIGSTSGTSRILAYSINSTNSASKQMAVKAVNATSQMLSGSATFYAVAGQIIRVMVWHDAATALNLSQFWNYASIHRVSSGSQAITAGEFVGCRYQTQAGNTVTHNAANYLDYGTKIYDSHSFVSGTGSGNVTTTNTGWKATIPTAGKYRITVNFALTSGGGWAAGEFMSAGVAVDGTAIQYAPFIVQAAHTTSTFSTLTATLDLLAGQRVEALGFQNSGASLGMNATTTYNFVEIIKVG